ncbi:angiomotin-like 2a [Scleropages formosus]|uniref:Angiomotin like 2b n=1 Tax=Scleropages formosus TaxID=113540 RepID=A0A8C9S4U9_SCLFO|nr:angiomotin-like 2a [Scleropages formosus]
MRTAEDSSGTVLHRLIQEQLRYGNPTDTRTLLAIQQQALRGAASPRSSLESLSPEEPPFPQLSARQEPQGQEHQGDCQHSESYQLYQLHGEELPTYEEAKAHSQYLALQGGLHLAASPAMYLQGGDHQDEGARDLKRSHARSLSERLLQLSLERNSTRANVAAMSSSHSYPQLPGYHPPRDSQGQGPQHAPPPEYPVHSMGYMPSSSQERGLYFGEARPPHPQHYRYVQAQQVSPSPAITTLTPSGMEVYTTAHASPSSNQMAQMEMLIAENESLRKEVEGYSEKAMRIQKLEQEIQRISEAYETLMKGCTKRESLEKTMRNKLEAEIKRLHDFNRDLRDRLETATKQAAKEFETADQNQHVLAKLIQQNEEHQKARERLEREVLRLQSSEEEHRHRADALEKALGSAQARARHLEEELRRKRAYVEKVERLQGALAQLQAACEKREMLEQRLRTRLEQELKALRTQQRQTQGQSPVLSTELSMSSLEARLREKEERILALEADMTKWEQKYLEESTMRQFAMDAAATAAAQRDTTIINHSSRHSPNNSFNEDLPTANHRTREMENRIRALYAQILEKDAVINVLQQRSRRDQGRSEVQGMRPARSVPSIASATPPPSGKVKSLSDDQTAVAPSYTSMPSAPPKPPSRDCSAEADDLPVEVPIRDEQPVPPEPSMVPNNDNTEEQQQSPDRISRDLVKVEAVEIFI